MVRSSAGKDPDTTSTSRSLLQRLRGNDPAAWDRLLLLYGPLVWHWCRRLDLPEQEIADVFQEVFQAVDAHLNSFHRDRPADTFRGWLRTIATNKARDFFRRQQRQPQAAGGSAARAWWAAVPDMAADCEAFGKDEREEHQLFRRALELIQDEFEERTWRAFWGVVVDGRTPQDVAEELGMSAGAVRVAKCRVLQRLRSELGDLHP
jgi:RNA polymerase sigma-70 factor (ECF subfamily)